MSKKKIKTKSGGPVKEVGILATRRGNLPDQEEINWLLALANEGRINEAAIVADAMTSRFPRFGFGWKVQGVLLYQTGQIADAVPALQKAAALMPGDPEAHFNLGNVMKDLGKLDDAVICYRKALAINPRYAEAHSNLGTTLQALGRIVDALPSLRRAAELIPNSAAAHFNLANALIDAGKNAQAVTSYRRTLELAPENGEAYINMASAQQALGQYDEAIKNFRSAAHFRGDEAEVHRRIGHMLKTQGAFDSAEVEYRLAARLQPGNAEPFNDLGSLLHEVGRIDEGIDCFNKSLAIRPDFAVAHSNLGAALHHCGRHTEALNSYRRAIAANPAMVEAHYNLGVLLEEAGALEEALASYRRASELAPDYEESLLGTGLILQRLGRLDEATGFLRQAIGRVPDLARPYGMLGAVLAQLGRVEEAIGVLRGALAKWPDYAEIHTSLQFALNYHTDMTSVELLEEARRWQSMVISRTVAEAARARHIDRDRGVGRRLRVGYVSGDFRRHAVAQFIEPVIRAHRSNQVETFGYFTAREKEADDVTSRFETVFHHWRMLEGLSDDEASRLITDDKIDVLIDLSGHNEFARLGVFAHRAAPVQAHYLGYFGTTGLAEMDFWIGDSVLFPVGVDPHFSETIWRLPRVWVSYQGDDEIPQSQWSPASNGAVRFGSFNNLAKLTPATMAVWARLLLAVPEATLVLKTSALADYSNRKRIEDQMSSFGVAASRLELIGRIDERPAHFAAYDHIDIALDPIGGLGGGTTTCDALWMGVPVVTLAADGMKRRMTASMLDAIGHREWIAETEEEYIEKVVTLSRNLELRSCLRSMQREKMRSSPLCDAEGLAEALEDAYMNMFDHWWREKSAATATSAEGENIRCQPC